MIANNPLYYIARFIVTFILAYIAQAVLIASIAFGLYLALSQTMFAPIGESVITALTSFVGLIAILLIASSFRFAVDAVRRR